MKYTHNPGKRCQFSKHLRVGKISNKNDSLIKGKKDWKELVEKYSGEVGFKEWEEKIPGNGLQEEDSTITPSFVYPIIRAENIRLEKGEINITCTIE